MGDSKPLLLDLNEDEDEGYAGYVPPQPTHPSISSSSSLSSSSLSFSATEIVQHDSPSASARIVSMSGMNIKDIETYIKMPVPDAFDTVRLDRANLVCFECENGQTTWVSLYLGVFICLNCAGQHRGLGSHLSFVRSVNLDSWTPSKLLYVLLGGNARAKAFFSEQPSLLNATLSEKYSSSFATDYKILLQKEHDTAMMQLIKNGTVEGPTRNSNPDVQTTPANQAMRNYQNATSISSDQFFGQKEKDRKSSRVCCC